MNEDRMKSSNENILVSVVQKIETNAGNNQTTEILFSLFISEQIIFIMLSILFMCNEWNARVYSESRREKEKNESSSLPANEKVLDTFFFALL